MKLRLKNALVIMTITVVMLIAVQMGMVNYIAGAIEEDEDRMVASSLTTAIGQLEAIVMDVNDSCAEWAKWDVTYDFIEDHDQAFIEAYLNPNILASVGVDIVLFRNIQGEIIEAVHCDRASGTVAPLDQAIVSAIVANPDMPADPGLHGKCLFDSLPAGLCLLSAHRVEMSSGPGSPGGSILMGLFVNDDATDGISMNEGVAVSLFDVTSLNEHQKLMLDAISNGREYAKETINGSSMIGYGAYRSVNGSATVLVMLQLPRIEYAQGMGDLNGVVLAALAVGLALSFTTVVVIDRTMARRVTTLGADVQKVSNGALIRVEERGKDEIALLARDINGMIESLERKSADLRESEQRYNSIIDQFTGGLLVVDSKTKEMHLANQAFFGLLGYGAEDLPSLRIFSFDEPHSMPLDAVVEEIKFKKHVVGRCTVLRRNDKTLIDVEVSGNVITYKGREAVFLTIFHISE